MHVDRRQFLVISGGAALGSALSGLPLAGQETKGTRLILLGTKGGPAVTRGARKNSSTLLLIEGVPYVVDCGYGTSLQLRAAGVALDELRYIFITHHHSDHNLESGTVVYNGWAAGLDTGVDIYGPPGLKRMIRAFFESMKFDIETRIQDEGRPDVRKLLVTHEFEKPGVIFENAAVRVTAARVVHPPITQSYAFRFDTRDRSVVISGDTAYSTALIELAKNADVLVHEAMYLPGVESLLKRVAHAKRLREHLMASHTLTEDVGKVAQRAGVQTLVLSHFVPGDDPGITDEQWAEGARKHFQGRIIVGRDLLEV